MANNKVQLANGTVLIDLTDTTATASDVASGSYFYDATGVKQAGTLTVDQTYSVTKTLTNVTTTVDDTKVIAGNSFFMDLTPDTGYAIRNITVTMGGVDITSQVFAPGVGERTIVANGTYSASVDGMSGYSTVTVNVPSGSADLGTKTITANGTYSAASDNYDGYSQVTVDVANSYSTSDEGKVVSSGALVAQTSDTVTQNGTVDTTLINSLTVNVSGGVVDNIILPGANSTITVSSVVHPVYYLQGYKNRRCILKTSGDHSQWIAYSTSNYATVSGLYPLPIPSGATNVNISATGPTQVIYMTYSWDGSKYVKVDDSGWVNLPITNGAISSSAAYIGITFRVNSSSANFTEANQPTNVSVTFE